MVFKSTEVLCDREWLSVDKTELDSISSEAYVWEGDETTPETLDAYLKFSTGYESVTVPFSIRQDEDEKDYEESYRAAQRNFQLIRGQLNKLEKVVDDFYARVTSGTVSAK